MPAAYLTELAEYWRTQYDWRRYEAKLDEFPQFTTIIDQQTLHFLHVRSPEPNATPLILLHGWPCSIVEFIDIIGPLTNPRMYGADPADAFHVVVPSLPGHGFSRPLTDAAWSYKHMAEALTKLMARIGYERYGVQGGDAGAFIGPWMGRLDAAHVSGVVTIRRRAKREANIVHWAEFERGGHFPALEVPEFLVRDLRKFFRQTAARS